MYWTAIAFSLLWADHEEKKLMQLEGLEAEKEILSISVHNTFQGW